jgi:hypothetical protein
MSSLMRPTTRTPALRASLAAATLALATSACTGDSQSAAEEPSARPSASPTPSATPSATGEQTESSPTPTTASPTAAEATSASPTQPSSTVETTEEAPSAAPVQPPPPGSGPEAMLLRAREMPGLNEQHAWRTIATENQERRQPVWACQVTDFSSIGATDVWVRRFVGRPGGADSAVARSAVITFADDQSAARAYAVLRAWHDRCEEQLRGDYRHVRVDAAPTAVDVENGQAEWRMAIYGPVEGDPDAGYFDATGYVRKGERISLTTMVSVGQDYNYPAGEEPIVGAVRNSAIKLLG